MLTGTPWGGADHFFRRAFEAGVHGDPDHASFHWTFRVNPKLDHAYLERQRDRISPAEYAAEVLGEWSDAVGALFPRELLDRQTADVEVPALGELRGSAMPLAGFDHGVSFDRSALAFVYRLPVASLNEGSEHGDGRPRFVVVPHVWPAKTPMAETVEDVARLPVRCEVFTSEMNGVGAMPSQEVRRRLSEGRNAPRRWNLLSTSNRSKTAGYGAVLGLLERGQLVLPRHPDLLRQLAGLRFEQGERGFTRIEAEDAAVHDDVADALMLAAAPYSRRGRAAAHLLTVAGEKAPVDAFIAPAEGGEVVSTGGGLRVWRRPPLQSVNGVEVSFPHGWDARPRRVEREPVFVVAMRDARGRVHEVQAGSDAHSRLVAGGAMELDRWPADGAGQEPKGGL